MGLPFFDSGCFFGVLEFDGGGELGDIGPGGAAGGEVEETGDL